MKDNKYLLAKSYTNNFYEVLSLHIEKKQLTDIKKKVKKYEDVSYIRTVIDDNVKNSIVDRYEKNKEKNIEQYKALINKLDEFYNTNLLNKEIIDVPSVKKDLDTLNKELTSANNNEYLIDINQLFEFKNNVDVELGVYISKHKSDEYMDMSIFHKNILESIKEVKDILNSLIENNQKEAEEYVNVYIEFAYSMFNILFENGAGKTNSMPNWAKGVLFCLPWIIGFCLFTLYPLIQTLIFSFSSVELSPDGFETTFIGFTNYINVFSNDTDFILALKNYLMEMLVYVPLITIFSLIIALLLNSKIRTKGFFRTIFFFPVIITSGPVIRILIEQGVTAMPGVKTMFDLNAITASMPELVRIAFNILTSEFTMILWFSGIQILVFVTALQKIDKGVYEASAIDGANKWEQFWKVTLPAINPSIVINVVFTTVMQSIFALNPIILKIQSDMNDTSAGKGYGYSSALAFSYFVIMIIVLIIFVLIFKKHERKGRRS